MSRPSKIRRLESAGDEASAGQRSQPGLVRATDIPAGDNPSRETGQTGATISDAFSRIHTTSPTAGPCTVPGPARAQTTPTAVSKQTAIKIEDPPHNPTSPATTQTSTPGCINLTPDGDLLLILTKFWRKNLHDFILSVLNKYNTDRAPRFTSLPDKIHLRVSRDYLRIIAPSFLTALSINEDGKGLANALVNDPSEAVLMLLLVIFNKSSLLPDKLDWLNMRDVYSVINKYGLTEVALDRCQLWKNGLKIPDWRPIEIVEAILYVGWAGRMTKAVIEEILKYHLFRMDADIMMPGIVVPEKLRIALKEYNAQRARVKQNMLLNIHKVLQEFLTAAKGSLCCMNGDNDARIPTKCHAAQLGSVVLGLHNSPYFGTTFCSNPDAKNPHSLNRLLEAFLRVEVWTTCGQPGPCSRFVDRAKRVKDLVAKDLDEVVGNFLRAWTG